MLSTRLLSGKEPPQSLSPLSLSAAPRRTIRRSSSASSACVAGQSPTSPASFSPRLPSLCSDWLRTAYGGWSRGTRRLRLASLSPRGSACSPGSSTRRTSPDQPRSRCIHSFVGAPTTYHLAVLRRGGSAFPACSLSRSRSATYLPRRACLYEFTPRSFETALCRRPHPLALAGHPTSPGTHGAECRTTTGRRCAHALAQAAPARCRERRGVRLAPHRMPTMRTPSPSRSCGGREVYLLTRCSHSSDRRDC